MENLPKTIRENHEMINKIIKDNNDDIEILVDILKEHDAATVLDIIDMLQNSKYVITILEEVRERFAEINKCCPKCGHSDFSEYENDNGMSGYYRQQWTETVCNNCGEQV